MEFNKIKEIIAEQMNIDDEMITKETNFTDDLGADSLDIYQIITELEDLYGLEFSSDEAENIKTIGDAVDYVKKARDE